MLNDFSLPKLIPPSGHSVDLSSLIRSIISSFQPANKHPDSIGKELSDWLNVRKCYYTSSGTSALFLILKSIARIAPNRDEVIVPAYCCPSIITAILNADLKPILCDIEPSNFSYSQSQLELKINARTIAVLLVHLFGFPWNSPNETFFNKISEEKIWIIEDAAQGFGNKYPDDSSTMIGTKGDAGFFSFGRGKSLSVGSGGLVVSNSLEIASIIEGEFLLFSSPKLRDEAKEFILNCAIIFFLDKHLYWIPASIPIFHIGETFYHENLRISKGSILSKNLLKSILPIADRYRANRFNMVRWINNQVKNNSNKIVHFGDYPYNRLPLVINDEAIYQYVTQALSSMGVSFKFYPTPLNRIDGLAEILNDSSTYINSKHISEHLITLPVHTEFNKYEARKFASIFNAIEEN